MPQSWVVVVKIHGTRKTVRFDSKEKADEFAREWRAQGATARVVRV